MRFGKEATKLYCIEKLDKTVNILKVEEILATCPNTSNPTHTERNYIDRSQSYECVRRITDLILIELDILYLRIEYDHYKSIF